MNIIKMETNFIHRIDCARNGTREEESSSERERRQGTAPGTLQLL